MLPIKVLVTNASHLLKAASKSYAYLKFAMHYGLNQAEADMFFSSAKLFKNYYSQKLSIFVKDSMVIAKKC